MGVGPGVGGPPRAGVGGPGRLWVRHDNDDGSRPSRPRPARQPPRRRPPRGHSSSHRPRRRRTRGCSTSLLPAFEATTPGCKVEVVAVGSGAAIKMGETGDADVLLVHSPAAEEEFMATGKGLEDRQVMYNDFVVVGPASDPAGIKGMTVASDAFTKIAEAKATFLSRGDDSGTQAKELTIWKEAGIEPSGTWYQETGQGMSATLRITGGEEGLHALRPGDVPDDQGRDRTRHPGRRGHGPLQPVQRDHPEGRRRTLTARPEVRRLDRLARGAGAHRELRRGEVRPGAVHAERGRHAVTAGDRASRPPPFRPGAAPPVGAGASGEPPRRRC